MNEYQKALDYITSYVFTGGNSILETEAEIIKNTLQKLVDKATPKKPIYSDFYWEIERCPNCKCAVSADQNYCDECGQALYWEQEEV